MFDKCIDRHKKPVCLWFHIIGLIVGVWGLWTQNWTWIIVAVVIIILGHLFTMGKKKPAFEEKPAEQTPSV